MKYCCGVVLASVTILYLHLLLHLVQIDRRGYTGTSVKCIIRPRLYAQKWSIRNLVSLNGSRQLFLFDFRKCSLLFPCASRMANHPADNKLTEGLQSKTYWSCHSDYVWQCELCFQETLGLLIKGESRLNSTGHLNILLSIKCIPLLLLTAYSSVNASFKSVVLYIVGDSGKIWAFLKGCIWWFVPWF